MYTPYFRGRQYELITIRESMPLLVAANVVPIIEPVKLGDSPSLSYKTIIEQQLPVIFIVNPKKGKVKNDGAGLEALIKDMKANKNAMFAVILDWKTKVDEIRTLFHAHRDSNLCLIHYHKTKQIVALQNLCKRYPNLRYHIMIERKVDQAYADLFKDYNRILIEDGFGKDKAKKNVERAPDLEFSDLSLRHKEMGYQGFGDFSIVGDTYRDGGSGKTEYAYAIHLTYSKERAKDAKREVRIKHFCSDTIAAGVDMDAKYYESLLKLKKSLELEPPAIWTRGLDGFKKLIETEEFPGAGPVKHQTLHHHLDLMMEVKKDS